MTPAAAIAMLDRQIARHGHKAQLVRIAPNVAEVSSEVRCFSRGYKPAELTGGIQQGDTMVTMSPTALAGTPFADVLPRANDKITIAGRRRNVQHADPVYIADQLVRLNLVVRG